MGIDGSSRGPETGPGDKKFLCFGLVMFDILMPEVEKLPEHWEETVLAGGSFHSAGGGAANSAITLGRLGAKVELAGKVGDDSFGEMLMGELGRNGVSLKKLLCQSGVPSGIALGLVNRAGQRCFITARGANSRLDPEEFGISAGDGYDYFFINGFFQFPQAENALLDLTRELHLSGTRTAFDMASWDASGRWMRAAAPFLPHIDCFFCNTSQLAALTGEKDQDAGAGVLKRGGAKKVIVKMGAAGCAVYGNEGAVLVGAPDLPVKDTTGAGDSFDGAYLFADALGWNDFRCGVLGNMVAGLNCGSPGATGGVPDRETAFREMARYYPLPEGEV